MREITSRTSAIFHYDPLTCAIAARIPRLSGEGGIYRVLPDAGRPHLPNNKENGGNRIRSVYDADGESFNRAFMETMLENTDFNSLGGIRLEKRDSHDPNILRPNLVRDEWII